MNLKKINIISFDVPYPANYGGTIEVYNKLKALYNAGFEIILHCFQYNRPIQAELNKLCKEVFYYQRKKGIWHLFSPLPYIIVTRNNKQLLNNLQNNNFPILFEGLHTCFFINHPNLEKRVKILRMHNIEHQYYKGLAQATTNYFKKIYFNIESKKLKKYEHNIQYASVVAAISLNDYNYFSEKHKFVEYLPAFHPYDKVISKPGKGNYFLYHGNLAVAENKRAILYLLEKVFNNCNAELIVAGKNPSRDIQNKINELSNVELVANPSEQKMNSLIKNAHCCILPTFQNTGLKLKLLVSLFSGRHVITNSTMVEGTSLGKSCVVIDNTEELINKINKIKNVGFLQKDIDDRKIALEEFTNEFNLKKLMKIF